MNLGPNVRFGIFLVLGAFFLLGPIETQVFLGPARSVKRPYLPMNWHMYHGVGVNYCQVRLYARRDGKRYLFSKEALSPIIGKGSPRSKKRSERFQVGKKNRNSDVLLGQENELPEIVKALCEKEPDRSSADVRAEMRCSPPLPSGSWRTVEDGQSNLCARERWAPVAGPPSNQPVVDPETGEVLEPIDTASESE